MIQNFFKIAWRNLKKNKGFTAINIIGLAIGMASAILIMLWINSELTYDRFFQKTDQLYIVGNKDKWNDKIEVWFSTPKPMAEAIKTEFPEVNNVTRVRSADNFLFTVGEKKVHSGSGIFVDSAFMNMFNLPVIAGDPQTTVRNPTQIILTETLAKNLFETNDIIGKTVKLDSSDVFTVGAVLADMPNNSFLKRTTFILPWRYMEKTGISDENWHNNSISTYIEVEPSSNIAQLQANFKDLIKRHIETKEENIIKPIADMWLYGKYENGKVTGGRIEMVQIFTIIAVFILLIACIN
ncbi:MAG: ABC transporter permease, partial [Sphingobacterium sp.]